MKQVQSAGIIVYYRNPQDNKFYYLLLHCIDGHWDLPKGKVEENETLEYAAIREVYEETGLKVKPIENFSQSISYYFRNSEREIIDKKVVFFVGEVYTPHVTISHEHQGYEWLDVRSAFKRLTYNNARNLLSMVNQFVHARYESNNPS